MNPQFTRMALAAALVAAVTASLPAQDKPPADTDKPAEKSPNPTPPGGPGHRPRGGPGRGPEVRGERPQPEMKPTPFIGVVTRELGPEVRAQTGIAEGFGLLVAEVMPDSPAKDAGLQQHDILVMLGDQRLVNMEQLSALVRAQKKGDSITLAIKRGGADQTLAIKVSERMMPADEHRGPGWNFRIDTPFGGGEFRGGGPPGSGGEFRERAEQFHDRMRDYQDRLQQWTRGNRERPMPQPPQFDGPRGDRKGPPGPGGRGPGQRPQPGHDGSRTEASSQVEIRTADKTVSTGNAIRTDDSGEYSIRKEDGKSTFRVKLKDGVEKNWPVNTDAERQAVPEEYRDKLQELESILKEAPAKAGSTR